jgi:hypothetical protein
MMTGSFKSGIHVPFRRIGFRKNAPFWRSIVGGCGHDACKSNNELHIVKIATVFCRGGKLVAFGRRAEVVGADKAQIDVDVTDVPADSDL